MAAPAFIPEAGMRVQIHVGEPAGETALLIERLSPEGRSGPFGPIWAARGEVSGCVRLPGEAQMAPIPTS